MTERIPVAGPWVTELEIGYVADAAANDWYERAAYYVQRFENAFGAYLGVKHAIAVPHCTSAIHLALAGLGIGNDAEVIVPDISWIASAAPTYYVGARPIFCDIDSNTWCMSVEAARRQITEKTRAIIPVGLYGITPDLEALCKLAREHGLFVIEDAAQALGSTQNGQFAGTFGDVGVFSFTGTKTLTTGEGGMLVTNNTDLYDRIQLIRDHGRGKIHHRTFFNTEVAYKYRMSSLQAAFGCGQLERIDELIAKKRQLFSWYRERLSDIRGLQLNAEPDGFFNTFWMTTVVIDPSYRLDSLRLMTAFDEQAIDVRPFFQPMSSLPAFKDAPRVAASREANPVAYSISPRGINLPSAMRMTEAQVDRVCDVLRQILRDAGLNR